MCNIHGLQKVETVGKTYMAVAGCWTFERKLKGNPCFKVNPAVKALNFAFEIIEFVKERTIKNGDELWVKIGLNTGPVISGVVG